MGLNLSNCQIAKELGLNEDDAHAMATHLREGLVAKVPDVVLEEEVEADEVYVIAGHKGNPEAVKKKAAMDAAAGSRVRRDEALWRKKNRRS
jgi:threonine aldolase